MLVMRPYIIASTRLLLGHPLAEIEPEVKIYTDFSRQIKLEPIVVKNEMLYQTILNLLGHSSPTLLFKWTCLQV